MGLCTPRAIGCIDIGVGAHFKKMTDMTTYRKIAWSIAILIWISNFIILIIALTGIIPDNPFKKYGFIIGMGLITITGLMRIEYKKQRKQELLT